MPVRKKSVGVKKKSGSHCEINFFHIVNDELQTIMLHLISYEKKNYFSRISQLSHRCAVKCIHYSLPQHSHLSFFFFCLSCRQRMRSDEKKMKILMTHEKSGTMKNLFLSWRFAFQEII